MKKMYFTCLEVKKCIAVCIYRNGDAETAVPETRVRGQVVHTALWHLYLILFPERLSPKASPAEAQGADISWGG